VTSPRNYLLVFLALTTLGGATLAWRQHMELIALRATLQEKDLDAQLHQHEFDAKLAAMQASASKKAAASTAEVSQNSDDGQRQRGRFGNMRALMNDPQFAQLMALQQKAALNSSYAPLFKQLAQQLGLSPAQIDAFQNLLVQKQAAARDVITAARDQGLNPATDRAELNQLLTQSNAEIDQQIQATLGDAGFAQYQNYEQTLPERNTVNELQQMLSYTNTPMTDQQANTIIQTLAANSTKTYNPTGFRALNGGNATVPITDAEVPIIAAELGVPPTVIQNLVPPINAPTIIRARLNGGTAPAPTGTAPTTNVQPTGR
jgi:hypothetical protein